MAGKSGELELPEAVRGIIEARTGDAIFVVGPDFRVVYWDAEAEFLMGRPAFDVVGKRCYEVVLGERQEGVPFCTYGCSVMQLARSGRPVSSYDMKVTSPAGEKRWVNVSILSVEGEDGPYLVHLLRDAHQQHETMEMAQSLIQLGRKDEPVRRKEPLPRLTSRQVEVLGLLGRGKTAREISAELYISESTARNHIPSLLGALGVNSQLELVAKARELGLVGEE